MGGLTTHLKCKVRHFLCLVVSVAVTSFVLSIYNQPSHTLTDIVTRTSSQFQSLKENIQTQVGVGSGWGGGSDKHLDVEEKYLSLLGFVRDEKETTLAQKLELNTELFGHNNNTVPIFLVTAVNKGHLTQLEDFLLNVQTVLPANPVIVWNIEPETPVEEDDDFSMNLKHSCNSTLCIVKRFNYEDYPEHVKDLSFRAYRPLILQVMLEAGEACSLWLDIDRRFIAQTKLNLSQFLELAKTGGSNGVVGWPSGHPTSSLTHPKMFPYFDTTAEDFYFHRMIDPSQLLLCKTEELHTKVYIVLKSDLPVMKPWVACSLKKECIAPFGAQSGGCRFDKKPLYRYSGCHAYDSAALNLALGNAFPMHQPYISRAPLTKPVQLLNSTTAL